MYQNRITPLIHGMEMTKETVPYECLVGDYIYDPKAGIPPGVEFDALPDDRICPECGAGKDQFVKVQE